MNPNDALKQYLITAKSIDKSTIQFYVTAENLFKALGEASTNPNILEVIAIQLAVAKQPIRRPLSNWLDGIVVRRKDF
jgi:hypothetical protein